MTSLLQVTRLTRRFGGYTALADVSCDVTAGTIHALIGPNGAGKTTLFNCLSGLYRPGSGSIRFDGSNLGAIPPHRMAGLGIGRTFQNLALFRTMSVRRNIMVGGHCRSNGGFLANALRLPMVRAEEERLMAKAAELIELLRLGDVAELPVSALPFGTQKRVELARALAVSDGRHEAAIKLAGKFYHGGLRDPYMLCHAVHFHNLARLRPPLEEYEIVRACRYVVQQGLKLERGGG